MTANDIITQARYKLSDSGAARWSSTVLLVYLSDAIQEVARRRPDLRLASATTLATLPTTLTLSTEIPFGATAKEALSYLVAAMALDEDSGDQANMNLAVQYRALARASLGG